MLVPCAERDFEDNGIVPAAISGALTAQHEALATRSSKTPSTYQKRGEA